MVMAMVMGMGMVPRRLHAWLHMPVSVIMVMGFGMVIHIVWAWLYARLHTHVCVL